MRKGSVGKFTHRQKGGVCGKQSSGQAFFGEKRRGGDKSRALVDGEGWKRKTQAQTATVKDSGSEKSGREGREGEKSAEERQLKSKIRKGEVAWGGSCTILWQKPALVIERNRLERFLGNLPTRT